jgi:hypothetical protein
MTGDGSSTNDRFSCQTGDQTPSARPTAEELSHRVHLFRHFPRVDLWVQFDRKSVADVRLEQGWRAVMLRAGNCHLSLSSLCILGFPPRRALKQFDQFGHRAGGLR